MALEILTAAGYRQALYACTPLAAIVVVGNSLAPPHVQIMTTFSEPLNAVVLIFGGYVLQVALTVATLITISRPRQVIRKEGVKH